MNATAISVSSTTARYWVAQAELSGQVENIGVLLQDAANDRLYLRFRRDWDAMGGPESEVFAAMEDGMRADAAELGATEFLEQIETTLSNSLRLSDRQDVRIEGNFERTLARLYRENVHAVVEPFVTHLPRYTLAAAAGKFLDNAEIEQSDWQEAPPDLRLTEQMFVASIAGRSMEPKIPDGSSCVFRLGVTGSRDGRLVLVEALGRGANDRYTVKRYRSEKARGEDGNWSHVRITLEPLNPEFEAWELEPEDGRYRILAEFVCVVD